MIPFTQFLRPNGERRQVSFDCDPALQVKADKLIEFNARFECEVLITGQVSFTVEHEDNKGEEYTLAIEVVQNAPEIIKAAVNRLIQNAYVRIEDVYTS